PTSGMIYFANQLENIAIYDVAGRQVYAQSVAGKSIDLSELNVGTYVLTAKSNGENIIIKVMVTK
ncbi:MAG: T9SS type A sorting domain-containing protein, partial [Paludibacteraceae bacterium]|nr:T9SS type A sorting domain-containing protein [Paludibacteraceae bacterium]